MFPLDSVAGVLQHLKLESWFVKRFLDEIASVVRNNFDNLRVVWHSYEVEVMSLLLSASFSISQLDEAHKCMQERPNIIKDTGYSS